MAVILAGIKEKGNRDIVVGCQIWYKAALYFEQVNRANLNPHIYRHTIMGAQF